MLKEENVRSCYGFRLDPDVPWRLHRRDHHGAVGGCSMGHTATGDVAGALGAIGHRGRS